ncbi:phosphatase PAP2 family protein [Parabacteroides sp. 52]|uniref:phosphatase PAP2 family protein n=1 Tax=unclassified Parabacteroides TaxID=2649774 RepID=UPI0013D8349D|nr:MULTISPECIES: phosphatase PAP2 family protein [unclassified Parabacteroides]MDH6533636.1 undecaprenyl-diphosphatase [Parabacteroides sp. PM5-20]NDV54388.1 phosphatase PAP2 family protein [Parabacteroides sp. 52]
MDINFPEWDKELFLYLNSKHVAWLDPVMVLLSSYTVWMIVCLAIVLVVYFRDRNKGKRVVLFLGASLLFNLLANNLIKLFFMRPRPGHVLLLKDIIHQLEEAGRSYSFFSAHSSTSFCLVVFSVLYLRNNIYGIMAFAWAMAVAYSRIYVGKHYPLDVLVGILFGGFMGWLAYCLLLRSSATYKDIRKR